MGRVLRTPFLRYTPCVNAAVLLLAALLQGQQGIQEKKAANGLSYCLRVPSSYNPKVGAPAVVWLHGSNMNSIDYVSTFIAQKWFPDWILIGIDGETGAKEQGHNYTFKSARLIVEAYDEIARGIKISKPSSPSCCWAFWN